MCLPCGAINSILKGFIKPTPVYLKFGI
jgi:hypothetical protein